MNKYLVKLTVKMQDGTTHRVATEVFADTTHDVTDIAAGLIKEHGWEVLEINIAVMEEF